METFYLYIGFARKQNFIFSSNKLLYNLGASYALDSILLGKYIEEVTRSCMVSSIEDIDILESWHTQGDNIFENEGQVGIIYIGGGNAVLAFNDIKTRKKWLEEYSLKILNSRLDIDLECGFFTTKEKENIGFGKIMQSLIYSAKSRRNFEPYSYALPIHAIQKKCPYSKRALDYGFDEAKSIALKLDYGKNAKDVFIKTSSNILRNYNTEAEIKTNEIIFSEDINSFDPEHGSNYNAIVHIDGNGFGKYFKEAKSIKDYRKKSIEVKNLVLEIRKELINHVIFLTNDPNVNDLIFPKNKDGKYEIPLRFIVEAGDDFTFITNGKLVFSIVSKSIEPLKV